MTIQYSTPDSSVGGGGRISCTDQQALIHLPVSCLPPALLGLPGGGRLPSPPPPFIGLADLVFDFSIHPSGKYKCLGISCASGCVGLTKK